MMNKIGFRISKCKEGFVVGQTENTGDWINRVVDIRDILKLYEIEPEKFAIMMSFSRTGAYITIARSISGRGGDNIAAWLYIPANIDVPAEKVVSIVGVIKEQILSTRIDETLIHEIFSETYPTVPFAEYKPSSDQKVFAKRTVPFYDLKALLGTYRYQSYYADYNAILIEDSDTMKVKDDPAVKDLTRKELIHSFVFCPPADENIPTGVTVLLDDDKKVPFDHPVRANKGQYVAVIFHNKMVFGAKIQDITYPVPVVSNNQKCDIPALDWKVKITRDMFIFHSSEGTSINTEGKRVYLTWKGTEIKPQGIDVTLDEAEKMRIQIKITGYETTDKICDFRRAPAVNVTLTPSAQEISVQLANKDKGTLTLRTKKFGIDQSPLKGFEYNDNQTLVPSQSALWIQRAIGFGTATLIVVILFILGLFTDFGLSWVNKQTKNPVATQQTATTVKKDVSGSKTDEKKDSVENKDATKSTSISTDDMKNAKENIEKGQDATSHS